MKKALIVASFGTTDINAREKSLDKIYKDIEEEVSCPCIEAYTSRIVKKRIKKNEDIDKLNEIEAAEALEEEGVEEIIVQPLHVITGFEYEKLKKLGYKIGNPLFNESTDYDSLIDALEVEDRGSITVFVGHGSDHDADKYYGILENKLQDRYGEEIFVSTIEGEDDLDTLLEKVEKLDNKSVLIRPLMIVSGVHVKEDLASDSEDSWKSRLEAKGYEVELDERGLGELEGIRKIFVDQAKEIVG